MARLVVCYADTGAPLRDRRGHVAPPMAEADALQWLRRKHWQLRGRPVCLATGLVVYADAPLSPIAGVVVAAGRR